MFDWLTPYTSRVSRSPGVGLTLILAGTALFVVNGGVSRIALRGGIDPATLTTVRVTGSLLVLVAVVAVVRPGALRPPRGRGALLLMAHGLIGVAGLQWTYFVAIDRLPLGMALLLEYQAPILVALWARFVQRESVRPRMWGGLALAVIGLAATTEVWNGLGFDGIGVLAGYGAAACYAAYFLLGEVGVATMDPLHVIVWSFAAAAVVLNVAAPATRVLDRLDASASALGRFDDHAIPMPWVLAWVVVLGTVIPFALVLLALRHLTATTATSIAMLEPVGAVALGWVWFGESLGAVAVLGCALVVAGILLAQTARATAHPEPIPA